MAKHCVFCGRKPQDKSKEHVVPRWLIELTGEPNRNAFFGFTKKLQSREVEARKFAFDRFTFPACSDCNQKYSDLEARAKAHLCNVLDGKTLAGSELSDFLDWFDKVRVGAWLGMRLLDKDIAEVEPNFHIETRLGQFDRMLIVEKSDTVQKRLNIGGAETLSFALTPSAFLLIVNGYYFTNISSMFLCSRRLGFPFIKTARLHPDREDVEVDLVEGRERIMSPILRKRVAENGRRFFQPMFKGGLMKGVTSFYNSNYVRNHSIDHESGVGNVFEESGTCITEYGKDDEVELEPSLIQDERKLHVSSAINILEWQTWLHAGLPDMSLLSSDQKRFLRARFGTADRINRLYAEHYRKML